MNNAAHLVGAELQFGTLSGSTFTPDSNAMIVGSSDGTINFMANAATFSKAVSITGALVVAGGITGSLSGNASSANKWSTKRTITLAGDTTGSVQLDGTANVTLTIAVNNDSHTHDGRYYTESEANSRFVQITGDTMTGNLVGASTKTISGFGKVYNAVWNDIADFIEVEENTPIEYGRVYIKNGKGHNLANAYAQKGIVGIASDTFGFGVGQKPEGVPTVPIAIGGFVLAYTAEYESGTPLTSGKDGVLVKANIFTRLFHPERVVATYYKPETEDTWHGLKVDGRHWVKVK